VLKCDAATFCGRHAVVLSNDALEVTVLPGGGHIASIRLAGWDLNPLWKPPWPTVEPEDYGPLKHFTYGTAEGRLLASLAGHFLCLDHFGELSMAEIAAGGYFHGEAPNLTWEISEQGCDEDRAWLTYGLKLPEAGLAFKRRMVLKAAGTTVRFEEDVTNLRRRDVPLAYQQHVTLGPPFLKGGCTRLDLPGVQGHTFPRQQGSADRLQPDRDFYWPLAPGVRSEVRMNVFPSDGPSCSLCTVLLAPDSEEAYVAISNAESSLLVGYLFPRQVFPWAAVWEENQATSDVPYLGRTLAWGIEFGSTPLPVTRMENLCAGPLFGQPRFLVLPAASTLRVQYRAFLQALPADWAGVDRVYTTPDHIAVRERGSSRTLIVP